MREKSAIDNYPEGDGSGEDDLTIGLRKLIDRELGMQYDRPFAQTAQQDAYPTPYACDFGTDTTPPPGPYPYDDAAKCSEPITAGDTMVSRREFAALTSACREMAEAGVMAAEALIRQNDKAEALKREIEALKLRFYVGVHAAVVACGGEAANDKFVDLLSAIMTSGLNYETSDEDAIRATQLIDRLGS